MSFLDGDIGTVEYNRLHLLMDRTSIKMVGESERETKKHAGEYCRQSRKAHLAIDA